MFNEPWLRFAGLGSFAALGLLLSSFGAATVHASLVRTFSSSSALSVNAPLPCNPLTRFDPINFSKPTKIDNEWLPLVPGTQLILEGRANRGHGVLPHRVVLTVTDLTKVIHGVRSLVLYDRDYNEGQLAEAELAFFAQDNAGNVWNLGEYPEEYENGVFLGAPDTWISGLARAKAGVHMRARPRVGTSSYLQGWAPEIDFLDCALVFKKGKTTCVPFDCYKHVLVTDEWSPLDPDSGHQRKTYAPGVGNIRVAAVGDPEGETLVLVKVMRLCTRALAGLNQEALLLDQRAYRVSDLYRQTQPAEYMPGAGRCGSQ